jgi:hypothetical protein
MLLHTTGNALGALTSDQWRTAVCQLSTDDLVRAGLKLITQHETSAQENVALAAVHWITENSERNGVRIPNFRERAAAFGMKDYLTDMTNAGWLTEKQLVDATGNMFDKDALLLRIGDAVCSWLSGASTLGGHHFPTPGTVAAAYTKLRGPLLGEFPALPPTHLPKDLTVEALAHLEGAHIRHPQPTPALKRRRGNATDNVTGVKKIDRCTHPDLNRLFFTCETDCPWAPPEIWGRPMIGRAGYIKEAVQQQLCMPDAIQQLLLGTPRANGRPDATDRVQRMHKEISEEYRHTHEKIEDLRKYREQVAANPANTKFCKSLPTDFSWMYCCAAMCPENCGYPILIEFRGEDDPKKPEGVRVPPSRTTFHGVRTWWNGDVFAIYTNHKDVHTDPVFWERGGYLHTGITRDIDPQLAHHIPSPCTCHNTPSRVVTMISQGMTRLCVAQGEDVGPVITDSWVKGFRIAEVLHHLDIRYWRLARAIAAQLRAHNIFKSQQVIYILFPDPDDRFSHAAAPRDMAVVDIPGSINLHRNTPVPIPRCVIVGEGTTDCAVAVLLGRDYDEVATGYLARVTQPSNLTGLRPVFFELLREQRM